MYVFRKVCIIKQYPNTTTNHLLPALIICSERAHVVDNNFACLDNKKSICLPSKLRVVFKMEWEEEAIMLLYSSHIISGFIITYRLKELNEQTDYATINMLIK